MPVRKFVLSDVDFERSPDQVGEVYAGNLVDQRHGAPVTIGFGRRDRAPSSPTPWRWMT
jgi:ethanolamine utilization protein EutQ (cupin superfamily)